MALVVGADVVGTKNLQTKNLKSIVHVAIEGMCINRGSILVEAIALWKNSRFFRWLFPHPEKYLSRHVDLEGEGVDLDWTLIFDSSFIFILPCMFSNMKVTFLPRYIIEG